MTLEITERKLTGTYHLSGSTPISRYNFAQLFAKIFDLDSSLIIPTLSKELKLPARRPKNSSLNTLKAHQSLKNKPLTIDKALTQLKTELC